jgi:hypothetical protein
VEVTRRERIHRAARPRPVRSLHLRRPRPFRSFNPRRELAPKLNHQRKKCNLIAQQAKRSSRTSPSHRAGGRVRRALTRTTAPSRCAGCARAREDRETRGHSRASLWSTGLPRWRSCAGRRRRPAGAPGITLSSTAVT